MFFISTSFQKGFSVHLVDIWRQKNSAYKGGTLHRQSELVVRSHLHELHSHRISDKWHSLSLINCCQRDLYFYHSHYRSQDQRSSCALHKQSRFEKVIHTSMHHHMPHGGNGSMKYSYDNFSLSMLCASSLFPSFRSPFHHMSLVLKPVIYYIREPLLTYKLSVELPHFFSCSWLQSFKLHKFDRLGGKEEGIWGLVEVFGTVWKIVWTVEQWV